MNREDQLIWESYNINKVVNKLSQNSKFKQWFSGSKVVDDNGNPLVVYHGTNKIFDDFSSKYFGSGNDQYGIGFYFTPNPSFASGFGEGEMGANVRPVFLNIKNPIESDKSYNFSRNKIIQLVKLSSILDDVLTDFGEVEYEGYQNVLNSALETVITDNNTYKLEDLNVLANTFYRDNDAEFVKNLNKVFGFDGVLVKSDGENIWINDDIWVAWFSEQILPIYKYL